MAALHHGPAAASGGTVTPAASIHTVIVLKGFHGGFSRVHQQKCSFCFRGENYGAQKNPFFFFFQKLRFDKLSELSGDGLL